MNKKNDTSWQLGGAATLAVVVAGSASFLVSRFHIAKSHEYLVRTGLGIQQLNVAKKAIQWPFQRIEAVDLRPMNYTFSLHNMSKEKVEFRLPINFTIGAADPLEHPESFMRYVQRMHNLDSEMLSQTILGIIEGETRGLTSVLTIEEMFTAKERFREEVVKKIQEHLAVLGLTVYNANIKEMADYDDKNRYFEYRKQRAIETANYEAQISVAEARKNGEIGVQERHKDTAIALASLNMETKLVENERAQKIAWSESQLAQQKAAAHQAAEMKRIEAETATQEFEQTRLKEVERKRQDREMETLRANEMTRTQLQAEQKIRLAEADASAMILRADAELEQERKRATGIQVVLQAHATGLRDISDQNPEELVKFYLGLKDRMFQEIAATQGQAFRDMKPNFQIWSTGPQANSSDPSEVITRTLQNMAPLFSGLQNQAGLKLPFLTGPHDK